MLVENFLFIYIFYLKFWWDVMPAYKIKTDFKFK